MSLPVTGGGAVICKVFGLSAGTCGFLQPFPPVPEEDVRVRQCASGERVSNLSMQLLADKVAKETTGLKSGFAIKGAFTFATVCSKTDARRDGSRSTDSDRRSAI